MFLVKKTVVALVLVLSGASSSLAQVKCTVTNLPRHLAVAFLNRNNMVIKYLPPGDCISWIRDVRGGYYIEADSDTYSGRQRGFVLKRYVDCDRGYCPTAFH
jgi:hypothetical protein